MYQTYKLLTDSSCSPYDVHLASNNKDSGVPMKSPYASTTFQKLLTKHNTNRKNKYICQKYSPIIY